MKYLILTALALALACGACSHDDEPERSGQLPTQAVDSDTPYDFSPQLADATLRIEALDGSLSLRYDRPGVMLVERPGGEVMMVDIATDIDASLAVGPSDTTLTVRHRSVDPLFVRLEHADATTAWYHILSVDSVRYVAVVPK